MTQISTMISFNKTKILILDYFKPFSLLIFPSHIWLFHSFLTFAYFLYCIPLLYYLSSMTIYFSSLFDYHHQCFIRVEKYPITSYLFHVMVQIKKNHFLFTKNLNCLFPNLVFSIFFLYLTLNFISELVSPYFSPN